jgi:SAM-dependent methyltransferase
MPNVDLKTVEGFGQEWTVFQQNTLADSEKSELFQKYFSLVDFSPPPAKVLDFGCGSGRWSGIVAPLVGELVAADASAAALQIARENVRAANVRFVQATPDNLPFTDKSFDLIFSLGVLHHVPDTAGAIASLARKLRAGGTLLLYLYYRFDNRPMWFRALWRVTDVVRMGTSKLPFSLRRALAEVIALCVYWPLARLAKHLPVPRSWPLKFYARRSFYTMRTDALDRFGTVLEKRFTKAQIRDMLTAAGLANVVFSDSEPYWVCKATKANS